MKASFTDITQWEKKLYQSTGGTRQKNIYISPKQIEYFFKGSKKDKHGKFKYPTEFWSEIIASKIGKILNFKVLDYNIAYDENDEQKIGCLSKSMVKRSKIGLTEGIEYLKDYNGYNPDKTEDKYTLEFIFDALSNFELEEYESKFIDMLIFDSIIGNSDRHQENWGFIFEYEETIKKTKEKIQKEKSFIKKSYYRVRNFYTKYVFMWNKENASPKMPLEKWMQKIEGVFVNNYFSPIYDNGCCLGRELTNEKINKMLSDENMLEAYIQKGLSEVRITQDKKKPKHLEMLNYLLEKYPKMFTKTQNRVIKTYKKDTISDLINGIDSELPTNLKRFKLPQNRKDLMIKLIDLRIDKLKQLKA